METCCNEIQEDKKIPWTPFLRQTIVCTGVWTSLFVNGLITGAPTVFIPQIRRENNSTAAVSDELASWLSSITDFCAIPWIFVLCLLSRNIGRKIPFIIATVNNLAAFIVFYCSTSVNQVLISEAMQGIFGASQLVVSIMILTEYTSPRYRGLFLVIKITTFYWGIWASNAIGTFFHWKVIGIIGTICSLYTLATAVICPESPYWLASKNRFKECAVSHRWLKGRDEESEKELEALINTQKEYLINYQEPKGVKLKINDLYVTMTSTEFYKPTSLAMLTGCLSYFTGKMVTTIYAIDIIKKITNSEQTAYTGMLILDGITVFTMYLGCALVKTIKRRTLLLTASTIGVSFLFILSLYLYLINHSIINENKYVTISLLTAFSIAVCCGPIVMSTSVYCELIPVRSRNLSICVISLFIKLIISSLLKISPSLFKYIGIHGAFLFFGVMSSIFIFLIYKFLPETKDKTLQEIADSIKGKSKDHEEASKLLNVEDRRTITVVATSG